MVGNATTTQPPQIWSKKPSGRASTGPLRWLTLKTWFGDVRVASSSPSSSTLLKVDFGTPSYEFTVNICTYLIF
jgi:hypothetical protein